MFESRESDTHLVFVYVNCLKIAATRIKLDPRHPHNQHYCLILVNLCSDSHTQQKWSLLLTKVLAECSMREQRIKMVMQFSKPSVVMTMKTVAIMVTGDDCIGGGDGHGSNNP